MEREVLNGRYVVTKELGQGGMGRVCLVEDTHQSGRLLALKVLLNSDASDDIRESFKDEFKELAKLRHPNLAASMQTEWQPKSVSI